MTEYRVQNSDETFTSEQIAEAVMTYDAGSFEKKQQFLNDQFGIVVKPKPEGFEGYAVVLAQYQKSVGWEALNGARWADKTLAFFGLTQQVQRIENGIMGNESGRWSAWSHKITDLPLFLSRFDERGMCRIFEYDDGGIGSNAARPSADRTDVRMRGFVRMYCPEGQRRLNFSLTDTHADLFDV